MSNFARHLLRIDALPTAQCGEFELSNREAQTLRRRLYSINRDGIRQYRTLRNGALLIVWRIK